MNKYYAINKLKESIERNSLSGNKENMFWINLKESDTHIKVKFEFFLELVKRGYIFFTEVIFKNGKRADIVAFSEKGNGTVIEIIHTEKEKSIRAKLNSYPIDFDFMTIKCGENIDEQLYL